MAASTIDDQYVHLFDLVPGPVRHGWLPPADSNGNTFTNSSHHNVATAEYDVGFKVGVYDRTNKGHAVFAYLQMGTASFTKRTHRVPDRQADRTYSNAGCPAGAGR